MTLDNLFPIARALTYVVAGFFIARFISKFLKKKLLLHKIVFYTIWGFFFIFALQELGFDLKVLLGATGVLTVAIGFASQTSASNFISGIFLLSENSLKIGDTILVNGVTGEIISVDTFSVKLRQNDNTLVRIPNEVILKTQVINLTHYRERRFECFFSIPVTTDIKLLRELIFAMLKTEPLCLTHPAPSLDIKEIGESNIKMQLYIWIKQKHYSEVKYKLQEKLLELLVKNNINIADSTVNIKLIGETHVRP